MSKFNTHPKGKKLTIKLIGKWQMTWSVIQKDKINYHNIDYVKQPLRQMHKPEQLLHLPHEQRQHRQESF